MDGETALAKDIVFLLRQECSSGAKLTELVTKLYAYKLERSNRDTNGVPSVDDVLKAIEESEILDSVTYYHRLGGERAAFLREKIFVFVKEPSEAVAQMGKIRD